MGSSEKTKRTTITEHTRNQRGAAQAPAPYEHNLEPAIYVLRLAGVFWAILVSAYFVVHFEGPRPYHFLLLVTVLTYPHIAHFTYRRNRSRAQHLAYLLADAFFLGCTIYIASFSFLPGLVASAVALGNALALNGIRWLAWSILTLAVGTLLPTALFGANVHPRSIPEIDLLCGVFFVTYFLVFAYATHARTVQLIRSRRELREQKLIAEIERQRVEGLLLSLLPAKLTREFRQSGQVAPREYPAATLVLVDFPNMGQVQLLHPVAEWLGTLNHCLQGFDAIASRYGLESLHTLGDAYLAVSGIPLERPTHTSDAFTAALEMHRFALELVAEQEGSGRPSFEVRIVVHTGRLIAGVTEARRFAYTVWGPAWQDAVKAIQSLSPWQIALSETTHRCLPQGALTPLPGPLKALPESPGETFFLLSLPANHRKEAVG